MKNNIHILKAEKTFIYENFTCNLVEPGSFNMDYECFEDYKISNLGKTPSIEQNCV